MLLFDTHCHFDSLDDAREQLVRAYETGVRGINVIGCDEETSQRSIDIIKIVEEERDQLGLTDLDAKASIGLHPHEAQHFDSQHDALSKLLDENKKNICAIGETGFDFY